VQTPSRASPLSSRISGPIVNGRAAVRQIILPFEHYRPESATSNRLVEETIASLGARCRLRRGASVPYGERMNRRRNALHAQLDQLRERRPAGGEP
jgi:hypothetical protein